MNVEPNITEQIAEAVSVGARSFEAITRGIQTLKGVFSSPKGVPVPQVADVLVDLREQVSLARDASSKLREVAAKLRDENTELKRRMEDFEGYELCETPLGAIVYRSTEGNQPTHYLCPTCKEQGFKSFPQGDRHAKTCQANAGHGVFYFEHRPSPPQSSVSVV